MRFSESRCRHCSDICPHAAVSLEGGLAIDPGLCRGCLLCTAVCPSGALEQNGEFSACLARLSRVPEPVLGCFRNTEHSNATLACLGGLSEEHLLSLYHTLAGSLTLNLSLCSDCPNQPMIDHLRLRMDTLSEAGLAHGTCRIDITESAQDLQYRDESVDRRGFFRSIRTSLFSSAAAILSSENRQTERLTGYSAKRVPARRTLLNTTGNDLSREVDLRIREHFDARVAWDENCSSCQGCVAICPTGALQTGSGEEPPLFDQPLCTGCGLCREFCLEGAVRITTADNTDRAA
jgi:Pyruvate/2-oxoacid:ferredoxin oxidoreductase delta subunit